MKATKATKATKAPRVKREKSTTIIGHYVRNADLMPAISEAHVLGKVTDKLIRMIQMIAMRYSHKHNFVGYSFREDMVSAAVMNLCNNALKFNPEKYDNPFSYYTSAIHNSFLQYMADEKKHRNIRDALLIDAGSNPSFNFMQGEKDESASELRDSDEIFRPEIVYNANDAIQEAYENKAAAEATAANKAAIVESIITGKPVKKVSPQISLFESRHPGRIPGPVTKYGPDDFDVDPITGCITIKAKSKPTIVVLNSEESKTQRIRARSVAPIIDKKPKKIKSDDELIAKRIIKSPPKVGTIPKAKVKKIITSLQEVKNVPKKATKKTIVKK